MKRLLTPDNIRTAKHACESASLHSMLWDGSSVNMPIVVAGRGYRAD